MVFIFVVVAKERTRIHTVTIATTIHKKLKRLTNAYMYP